MWALIAIERFTDGAMKFSKRCIVVSFATLAVVGGCSQHVPQYGTERQLTLWTARRQVWAIAPAVNLSGQNNVDPLLQADLVYEQLQAVRGLTVIPVNRVAQVYASLKLEKVDTAEQAAVVCDLLGCDGLIVPTVTDFDPYSPPKFGGSLQLFGKPRGFSVFGSEAASVLAGEPVSLLPGIGPAQAKRLQALGISSMGQLAALNNRAARLKLGDEGPSLAARARGEDLRIVHTERDTKSISAETTFDTDIAVPAQLERYLWQLCEKLGRRLREQEYAAAGIVLKLKTAAFASRTRSQRLANPTQLPETLFEAAKAMLAREADGTAFRLIGIGASPLAPSSLADQGDLADTITPRRAARQAAIDTLRQRFGNQIVTRGIAARRGLAKPPSSK